MLKDYKKDFPWFKNNPELVYVDNAATTLKPQIMIHAMRRYYEKYTTVLPLDQKLSQEVMQELSEARSIMAQFLQADYDETFYTSGSTESLNIVSFGLEYILKPGDEIIVSYMEHGSNILPWYRLRERNGVTVTLFNKEQYHFDLQDLLKKITSKTKVVAIANASNLLAIGVDVKEVIQAIKEIDSTIFVVVDATQYLEHFAARCHDFDCDFLAGSAHKLLGPTGLGFLYIKKEILNRFPKIAFFPVMVNNVFDSNSDLNFAAIYAFKFSLKYWMAIGYDTIVQREQTLKKLFLENLKPRDDLVLYNKESTAPLITFNFKNHLNQFLDGQDIEYYLEHKNIMTRSSLSCAKLARYPLCTRSVVRASMLFYNDENDIKKLAQALNTFQEGDELNGLI